MPTQRGSEAQLTALSTAGTASDAGEYYNAGVPECPGSAVTTAARGTAQRTRDVYYQSHAFPRQTNHQQRKPTRPPTTTTAATEIPAIAPVERLTPPVETQAPPSSL